MLPDLLSQLTGEWREPLREVGVELRPPLTALKASGPRGKDRKVNFLVFESGAGEPSLILKLARSTDYQAQLRREHEALRGVSSARGLNETAPRPAGLFERNGQLILAETALPGVPLSILLRQREHLSPESVRDDLRRVREWLLILHKATTSGTVTFAGNDEAQRRLDRLARVLGKDGLSPAFVRNLQARADSFQGLRLPLAGRHGDFWPGNFLMAKGRSGVIDWEHFRREAWPLYDAFTFVTTYARTYPHTGWEWGTIEATFRRAFLEDKWLARATRDFVVGHLNDLGLPTDSAHLFLSLFLIEMADPTEQFALRRPSQQAKWAELLTLYAENERDSIFAR